MNQHVSPAAAADVKIGLPGAGLVVAATIGNMLSVSPVILATFGLFLVPIATEFGWPRSVVSGALAVAMIGSAAGAGPAGRIADRFGTRRTILAGNVLFAVSVALLATAGARPALFLFQFMLVGLAGALASGMVIAKLLADSFDSRRGFLIGIAGGVGNGVGSAILPLLAAVLVAHYGWRGGYLGLSLAVLLLGYPILHALVRTPAVENRGTTGIAAEGATLSTALKDWKFWFLATSMPLGGGCLQALFATIVPILSERGTSIEVGSSVVATFALTCAVWEPAVGFLLDTTTRPRMVMPCYAAGLAGLLLLLFAKALPLVFLSGVLLGLALGAEFSALAFLLSRYFGRRELGAISGIVFGIALLVAAATAVLLNICFDMTGSYRLGILALLPLLAWNSIAMAVLPDYTFVREQA